MESIIVNTVSASASKGRRAIDWVADTVGQESKVNFFITRIYHQSYKLKYDLLIPLGRGALNRSLGNDR